MREIEFLLDVYRQYGKGPILWGVLLALVGERVWVYWKKHTGRGMGYDISPVMKEISRVGKRLDIHIEEQREWRKNMQSEVTHQGEIIAKNNIDFEKFRAGQIEINKSLDAAIQAGTNAHEKVIDTLNQMWAAMIRKQ